ncbi:hypothetical protein BU23DRAFT_637267 [Bimuria novae-zelandiae CBS 107.79]|uniref:Uncharacterized protein n=1 Tax=Bimuria novae-zelandiae CBS 107.79 TaxID=1447943 RepID=A0A6A5VTC7_9PLEO|nr:hypothetical protein BU23DRAFT_637267 [Bimuria novae-zelandiae CBS 107.79]
MEHSLAERIRVYLVCRAIFTGQNAQLRKQTKIRELVEGHKTSLEPLTGDLGIHHVVDIIRDLLDERIFQSELKAKVEFPGLFVSSPERDIQAPTLRIMPRDQLENELDQDDGAHSFILKYAIEPFSGTPLLRPVNDVLPMIPSLYPSYLPYTIQHIILTTAQRILEECCFDFAKRWLPSIFQNNGWDCAAAAELTKWTRVLAKHSAKLPQYVFASSGFPLNEILFSTHKLRHSAVHRLPTTARGVSQLVESALRLTETLQDHLRAAQLEELHSELDSKTKTMELNKKQIRRQREELDKKDECLRANTLAGDSENKLLIGSLLEESVRKIFYEDVESHSALGNDQDALEVQRGVKIGRLGESHTEVSS